MRHRDTRAWMLAEAVELLRGADRLQRQFFRIGPTGESPCWEPPIDMYENEHELGLLIALPDVAPEHFEVTLEPQAIVVRGARSFGSHMGQGKILQMEIPYGRFERRIRLPDGGFRLSKMLLEHGCLRLTLERLT